MIWILIVVLINPVFVEGHPTMYAQLVYPKSFVTNEECMKTLNEQYEKDDVKAAYCQEVKIK